jgi:hypothetical protein
MLNAPELRAGGPRSVDLEPDQRLLRASP